jgi:glycine C-acetyltransferase
VRSVKEFAEIWDWMKKGDAHHECMLVNSLPNPRFYIGERDFVSFSTNNYLALADSQRMKLAAIEGVRRYGVANCESRLLGGDLAVYRELEAALAKMKRKPSAIIYATGYLTNLGVLSSLIRAPLVCRSYGFRPIRRMKSAYFSDEYNHISIREGIRVSEAPKFTYRHLDLNHLESGLKNSDADTKIIVTDGVFSQDGDIAPLPELVALADRYDALVYVDDAHGTGVLGETGGGISEHFGCYSPRLIHMGTLSKAYGAIGGFVAAEESIVEILRLSSPAYGFTSTLPPDQACAVLEAIAIVRSEPERRERLWRNQRLFVREMESVGFKLVATQTPILPVVIGDERVTDAYAGALAESGYHVDSVKFPAVARGSARLRFIMNANHTEEEIRSVVCAMVEVRARVGGELPLEA